MMKEEEARIRVLTEIAYDYDPRVLQHKEELRLKQEQIKAEREVSFCFSLVLFSVSFFSHFLSFFLSFFGGVGKLIFFCLGATIEQTKRTRTRPPRETSQRRGGKRTRRAKVR